MRVFQHRQPAKKIRLLQNNLGSFGKHIAQSLETPPMMLGGAFAFSKPNYKHLGYATFKVTSKIGMGLNPRNSHDRIRCQGVFIPINGLIPRILANNNRVHVRLYRNSKILFGNPILSKQLSLPIRISSTMTSHRRNNKRLGSNPLKILNRCFHNYGKVGNTSTTNTNGNIGARLDFLLQTRVFPLQQGFHCNIFNFRLLCYLLHKCQCWNMHNNHLQ